MFPNLRAEKQRPDLIGPYIPLSTLSPDDPLLLLLSNRLVSKRGSINLACGREELEERKKIAKNLKGKIGYTRKKTLVLR